MPTFSLKNIKLTNKQKNILITAVCVMLTVLILLLIFRKDEFKIQAGSPAETMSEFYNYIQKGDIDKAATLIDRSKIYLYIHQWCAYQQLQNHWRKHRRRHCHSCH